MTLREPYGVIGCMVPWNSPMPLMIDTAAPALAAGNAVVVKTPEDAPASIVHFARLAVENGLPAGLLNVVSGRGAEAGEALVGHPGVAKLVFVGGGVVGRRVAAAAAQRLVPVMLELGGKSPQIVLPDADLDNVVLGLVSGVIAAAGQTCVAGSRALIHEGIYEEVLAAFAARVDQLAFGDPLAHGTEIGPLASARQIENALRHVEQAKEDGARLVAGGGVRDTGNGQGKFFEPAIFGDVKPSHRLFQSEVFGPIIGFTPFSDIEEALALANDSVFGLASGLWTQNIDTALTVAKQIKAGTVWINTYRAPEQSIASGGYKESGYGRIGGSRELYEFTREKTIIINHSGKVNDPFVMGG
jgi:aldehyde dehydrogenase (NAD+)